MEDCHLHTLVDDLGVSLGQKRCTDESQVPSIVMTASRRVQLGARRGRSGHRLRGMVLDAR